ncbi:MAG TPA: SDR family oxidoreductase [Bacillota bacterium]|nr:SDR family oxidoreductase [Bacillota bacterium]
MARRISDLVTVITGASSGIGRATALRAAEKKGAVVLASRQENSLNEVARECERLGGCPLVVKTDVTDPEQMENLARRAVETYGRLDAWVNGAAVTMLGSFEEAPAEAFRKVIETNLFGYVNGARAVLPYFREQGHGILINIASVLGKVGAPYSSAYVASKFAVTGFSESLRMELRDAPHIHVCTILPATIDTPLFQHAANFSGRAVQAMPPVYSPEQVADAILATILHPKREVTVGNVRRILAMRRMAPPLSEKVIAKKVENQHFAEKSSPASLGNLFEPMPQYNTVHGGWLELRRKGHKSAWAAGTLAMLASAGTALYLAWRRRRSPIARVLQSLAAAAS